ncbi:MAG: hypothetical protein JRG86_05425 [Deltaproteobacteria bacterium]|jgi:hypothetical protein|nr:hypothetical protein [Deltaproteobacteria bacterium]
MTPDEYAQGVIEAYQGEIAGQALYGAAAAATREPTRRPKLRALAQLELETAERLRPIVERLGGLGDGEEALREAGSKLAESLFPDGDWPASMGRYAAMIEPYVRKFQALEAAAPVEDTEIMAYLVAHEQAQVSFATREAEGDVERAIEPVLALLSRPPEGV